MNKEGGTEVETDISSDKPLVLVRKDQRSQEATIISADVSADIKVSADVSADLSADESEMERLFEVHRQEREVLRQEQADIYHTEYTKMQQLGNPVRTAREQDVLHEPAAAHHSERPRAEAAGKGAPPSSGGPGRTGAEWDRSMKREPERMKREPPSDPRLSKRPRQ